MLRHLPFELEPLEREVTLTTEFGPGDIEDVYLVGLRDRWFKLIRYEHAEFREFDSNMRGMPTRYATFHKVVKFWPTPIHYWRVVISVRMKDPPSPKPLIEEIES